MCTGNRHNKLMFVGMMEWSVNQQHLARRSAIDAQDDDMCIVRN